MLARVSCRCLAFRLPCASSSVSLRLPPSLDSSTCRRCYSSSNSGASGDDNNEKKSPPATRRFLKPKQDDRQGSESKSKPKPADVIDEKLLDAVSDVASQLHKNDTALRKKTKEELIAKLVEHEKATFRAATDSQTIELLTDSAVVDLLTDANAEKQRPVLPSRAAERRHAQRGLVLLRREVFSQAQLDGFTASEARVIAEKAAAAAEERARARSRERTEERRIEEASEKEQMKERSDREHKLYEYAFRMAEQMLYPSLQSGFGAGELRAVEPDETIPNILSSEGPRLDVFSEGDIANLKPHSLKFWADSDARALKIWSQSFGPKNGFEEMIELTKQGKMWPYPINNEYLCDDEANVSFHKHIFLERKLTEYNLPKTGPIAHFMELVCVGLSKNPYMSVEKKYSHIDWFAKYFIEKGEEIERLHKQEQQAAGAA